MTLLTATYLLLAALLLGILLDAYTTKVGLSLGLSEKWPVFKGKTWRQILAIKLVGFAMIAFALLNWLALDWTTYATIALTVIQYWAALLNWKKVRARR